MAGLWKYFILTVLILMPRFACADFDVTSYLVQLVKSAEKDGVGKIMKGNMADLQKESTNLVDGDFSNINPDKFKSTANEALKAANKQLKLDDKIPSDMVGVINGAGSNPLLSAAVKKIFTVNKRSGDDVEKNKKLQEKNNDFMIENVSAMYARALVRRYQLENEKKETIEDFNNIPGLQAVFLSTIHRANSRWITMLQSEASLILQTSNRQFSVIRPDDAEKNDKNNTENNTEQKPES